MRPEIALYTERGVFERIFRAEEREILDYLRYLFAAYLENKMRQKSHQPAVYLPYLPALRVHDMQPAAQGEELALDKISVISRFVFHGEF